MARQFAAICPNNPPMAPIITAMAVPTLFGEPPIYDSFAKRK